MTSKQRAYIDGLRALVQRLEESPELVDAHGMGQVSLDLFYFNPEELRAASKLLGGQREKRFTGGFFEIVRSFGPHEIVLNLAREEVCERVVVGTEHIPASPAHDIDVIEWRCQDTVIQSL